MKTIKLKRAEKRELKGPSLTIKWALASSFFIFVVFTIFAVITYKSSVNLIVAKERRNLERTTSEVVSRLANSDKELTITDTYRNLSNSSYSNGEQYEKITTIEGTLMQIDPFISELGQDALNLYVYNLDGELVFETQQTNQKLFQEVRKSPTIITLMVKQVFYR